MWPGRAGERRKEKTTVLIHALRKELVEEVVFEVVTETKYSTVSNTYLCTNLSLTFMRVEQELGETRKLVNKICSILLS